MTIDALQLQQKTWCDCADLISQVREQVFVQEQGIAPSLVWDDKDSTCRHYLLTAKDRTTGATIPLAAARVDADGKLGRMAVVQPRRALGLGQILLRYIIAAERELGTQSLYLHAQQDAIAFYKAANFVCYGDIFIEADIPHQAMRRQL